MKNGEMGNFLKFITRKASKKTTGFFVPVIIAFVTTLFLFLLIITFNYLNNSKIIKSNIENYNMQITSQIKLSIDEHIDKAIQKLSDTCYDKNVFQFALKHEFDTPNSIMDALEIIEYNNSACLTYEEIKDVFIYFNNTNILLNRYSYAKPEDFFSEYMQDYITTPEQWKAMLSSYKNYEFILSSKTNQDVIIFKSVPLTGKLDTVAMVGVRLDGSKLVEKLSSNLSNSQMNLYILDRQTNRVSHSNNQHLMNIQFLKDADAEKSGFYYDKIEGENCLVTFVSSDYDAVYVSVIPVDSIMRDLFNYRILNAVLLIMFLLFTFVMYVYVKKQSYNPVRNLVAHLKNRYAYENEANKNEIQIITGTIERLSKEREEIQKNLALQYSMIQNNMLIALVKQVGSSKEILEDLHKFDIIFSKQNYVVLCIDLEEAATFDPTKISNDKVLLKTIMTNIAQDVFVPCGNVLPIEFEWNKIVIILNSDSNANDFLALTRKCASDYVELLNKLVSLVVTIGISSCNSDLNNIGYLYQEAEEALTYKFLSGTGTVNLFEEQIANDNSYFYPIYVENKLINSIAVGNKEQALEIVQTLFFSNFKAKSRSVQYAKCLFFDLISTVLKLMNELKIEPEAIFGEAFNIEKELMDSKTADEMHDVLCQVIGMICEYLNSNKKKKNEELIQIIQRHIAENYRSENICITSIADAVNITQNYLSHYFKEKTGTPVMKYIEKLRLEKAKELLRDPQLTLDNIAQKVGFSNSAVLIRSFKKEEGVTPGQYRSAL